MSDVPDICRFCRLGTSKALLTIPSCHFTIMLQLWPIVFLGINKFPKNEPVTGFATFQVQRGYFIVFH